MSVTAVEGLPPSSEMDDSASIASAPTALGAQAARGTVAALLSQAIMIAIYAGASLALARLLSPEDFGIFAIAFAVVGVLDIAQHGGMILPLVQTRTLTRAQLGTLFWFCAAVGAAQSACGWLVAPLVSWLYADPRIGPPIIVLALGYLTSGFTAAEVALMRRRMRFGRLAMLEVSSVAIAATVAVVSAWYGAGYWSLVYLQVTRQLFFGAMLLIAGGVPRPQLDWTEIAPLVRFGRVMVAFEAIGFVNSKIDNLIVGWYAGPAALGFYAKAFEFLRLSSSQINLPIGHVVHATLSRVQDDARRFRTSLIISLLLSASLGVPLIVFIAAHAPLLFVVLFGEKWLPAAGLFRALAPGALTMTIGAAVGWIFVSLGRAHRQLPWALATSAATLTALVAGARWGALGVATAFSAIRVVLFIPTLMFTCHGTPVAWLSIVRVAARPVAASAIAALVSSTMGRELPAGFGSLSFLACVFAACYVGCWVAFPGGLPLIRQQVAYARGMYHRG